MNIFAKIKENVFSSFSIHLTAYKNFTMQAIREIKTVSGKKITIDLPDGFCAKEVEVIVIPHEQTTAMKGSDDWKKDFSSVSQWDISEEEIKLKSWSVKEF